MMFDIVLPSVLFLCASIALALSVKYDKKVKPVLDNDKKVKPVLDNGFRCRDAVLIVAIMGFAVCVLAFVPEWAIMFGLLFMFVTVLFGVTYTFTGKWYLAILSPVSFATLYLFSWNAFLLDMFAMTTAVPLTVLFSASISWEASAKEQDTTTKIPIPRSLRGPLLFVILLATTDVALVCGTNLMETVARKLIDLQLPLLVMVPTFPSTGHYAGLGLGDIFLSGLLGIITAKKMGRRFAMLSIFSMAATLMLGQTAMMNSNMRYFPATILVITGWLSALAARRLSQFGCFHNSVR